MSRAKQRSPQALQPHPVLSDYYSDEEQRYAFVRGLFDRTARYYDPINRIFSFGSGVWYRRRALLAAGLGNGMRVLDVATGTGLVARPAARIVGPHGMVVGLDLSWGMLNEARRALELPYVQGASAHLPIADDSFDFLSIGYALRHVGDVDIAFGEFHRVLRVGGTLLILEITPPDSRFLRTLTKFYIARFVPWLCRWMTKEDDPQTLMRYYWDTIENCVSSDTILDTLAGAGFSAPVCRTELGVLRAYTGKKE